jgi:hypothetical protein
MLVFLFPKPHTIGPQFARRVGFPNVRDPAVASLRHAWLDAVTDHPGSYLAARWTLWLRQIGITRNGLSVYPPDMPNNGGYTFAFPRIYNGAMTYLEAFTHPEASFYGQAGGDFLFTVWCYLLPALLSAIVFLRRGTAAPLRVVGALGVSALTYQAGLFVAALGTRFRFEFPCVAVGMVAAAILLRVAWARWRSSSPATELESSSAITP